MKFAKATKFHRKSGGGTAETGENGFSRPFGTGYLSVSTTQDCVLGYFQVAPSGLDLKAPSSHTLSLEATEGIVFDRAKRV